MLVALGLAGCGAGAARPTSTPAAAQLDEGRHVYATACTGCHSLAARPSPELNGGGLGDYRLTPAQVASFVKVMPLPRALTSREIAAVSAYVAHVEARAHEGRRP